MSDQQNAVQMAMGNTLFHERVAAAAASLGVPEDQLAMILVDTLGADTPERLARLEFLDLMKNVPGAKAIPVREALDAFGASGRKGDGSSASDLVKSLRDETKILELTGGRPLLCESGGNEHSAANIRYYRKTGTVPKLCVFAGCKQLLQHAKSEVSFEDGVTFLTADGLNPTTGRDEGKFSLADRALAFHLIRVKSLTVDEAWRRLEDGSLRTHFTVAAVEHEAERPYYANDLRKPFQGARMTSDDPFHRNRGEGHARF